MDSLFLKIEDAENQVRDAESYWDAIVSLSNNKSATCVLLDEFHHAVIAAEEQWRAIEQSAEYRARYTSREDAHADFCRKVYTEK